MCGIFGVYGHPEAANLTYLGLYALQHRGQEGVGICSSDGHALHLEKGIGLVADLFSKKRLNRLPGNSSVGHNRYSTAGSSSLKNVQPIMVKFALGSLSIVHNGNLTNAYSLKEKLEDDGAIFQSDSDSEVIIHLIAHSRSETAAQRILHAVDDLTGAYSLLILREKELIAIRDPYGVRPLSLGEYDGAYILASETCSFDIIGATFIRDVEPGEMLIINDKGIRSIRISNNKKLAHCIFEFIYFARPDSNIFSGQNVNEVRKEFGRQLARESHVDADVVIPVPDSGVPAAIGYAEESKIPFDFGLIRNHYVGRTFIEPRQSIRHFGVKIKLNAVRRILMNKKVIVVDDSIVRGTTSKKIVKMLKEVGGAKEVHMRISSPSTISPCYYGIDTPTRGELIASTHLVEEIIRFITADSLSYLSLDGLMSVVPNPEDYCYACFNNKYPINFPDEQIVQMELFMA